MGQQVHLPGPRSTPATLDEPADDRGGRDGGPASTACVVACPPHPELGGRRSDTRLRAVGDALTDRGVACLRFDYGPWDEGRGEQRDARSALAWADERFDAIGLFGYSFGAGVALCATVDAEPGPGALSVLAPPATLGGTDVAACLPDLDLPLQVIVGERDVTVDSGPVADRARDLGHAVEVFPGDHHFVGQADRLGTAVAEFSVDALVDRG
jgi:alpha/beta superfamily hydrolase